MAAQDTHRFAASPHCSNVGSHMTNEAEQPTLFDSSPWSLPPAPHWTTNPRDAPSRLLVAGGLIFDREGRLLLIHRQTPHLTQWEIPGGKVSSDEPPDKATQRELAEELGIRARIIRDLGAYDFAQDGRKIRYLLFLVEVTDGTPRAIESHTFDQVQFFTFEELKSRQAELSPNAKNVLRLISGGRLNLAE
jgi:mutator protein MutT